MASITIQQLSDTGRLRQLVIGELEEARIVARNPIMELSKRWNIPGTRSENLILGAVRALCHDGILAWDVDDSRPHEPSTLRFIPEAKRRTRAKVAPKGLHFTSESQQRLYDFLDTNRVESPGGFARQMLFKAARVSPQRGPDAVKELKKRGLIVETMDSDKSVAIARADRPDVPVAKPERQTRATVTDEGPRVIVPVSRQQSDEPSGNGNRSTPVAAPVKPVSTPPRQPVAQTPAMRHRAVLTAHGPKIRDAAILLMRFLSDAQKLEDTDIRATLIRVTSLGGERLTEVLRILQADGFVTYSSERLVIMSIALTDEGRKCLQSVADVVVRSPQATTLPAAATYERFGMRGGVADDEEDEIPDDVAAELEAEIPAEPGEPDENEPADLPSADSIPESAVLAVARELTGNSLDYALAMLRRLAERGGNVGAIGLEELFGDIELIPNHVLWTLPVRLEAYGLIGRQLKGRRTTSTTLKPLGRALLSMDDDKLRANGPTSRPINVDEAAVLAAVGDFTDRALDQALAILRRLNDLGGQLGAVPVADAFGDIDSVTSSVLPGFVRRLEGVGFMSRVVNGRIPVSTTLEPLGLAILDTDIVTLRTATKKVEAQVPTSSIETPPPTPSVPVADRTIQTARRQFNGRSLAQALAVLGRIKSRGGQISDAADAVAFAGIDGLPIGSLSALIHRLVSVGLITRQQGGPRPATTRLTPLGEAFLEAGLEPAEPMERAAPALTVVPSKPQSDPVTPVFYSPADASTDGSVKPGTAVGNDSADEVSVPTPRRDIPPDTGSLLAIVRQVGALEAQLTTAHADVAAAKAEAERAGRAAERARQVAETEIDRSAELGRQVVELGRRIVELQTSLARSQLDSEARNA